MKPKLWDGPNAVGEARERFNETLDTPYQTALGPGFSARKMNGFAEVTGKVEEEKETPLPRFYIMGRIGGINKLSGSNTAKGTFRKLGSINEYDFSIPNINYIGGGYGIVPGIDPENADYQNMWLTTDAKRFRKAVTFPAFYNPANRITSLIVQGAQSGNRKSTFTWGLTVNLYDSNWYSQYYFYQASTNEWLAGASLTYPDKDCGSHFVRIGPTSVIAFTGVFRMTEATTLNVSGDGTYLIDADPDGTPRPFLQRSVDNGLTWIYINISSIFDDYADKLYKSSVNFVYSSMTFETMFFAATPLKTVMVTEFYKHTDYDRFGFELDPLYEYRVYHLVGSSLTKVATLNNAVVNPIYGYFANESDSTNRKCVVLDWVTYGYGEGYPRHVLCFSFDQGVTWVYRQKPWEKHLSGFVSWLDEDTLVCPAYSEGEYALFETKDFGVTWKKRATTRKDGDAPSPSAVYLQNFSLLREFRDKKGGAAAVSVAAEWMTDPSVQYVPPT